jgi:hypothetical protein
MTSLLVQHCQKAMEDISTQHAVGLFCVPGHSGVRGNEIADKLARDRTVHDVVGPEPALGVSGQNIRNEIKRWLDNQRMVMWRILVSTQRQARKIISGPSPAAKTRSLSFNRTHSRVVTGLLTGHNTLRKHIYIMELSCSPLDRRCEAEEETSIHVLCECEALASLKHTRVGFIFLDP